MARVVFKFRVLTVYETYTKKRSIRMVSIDELLPVAQPNRLQYLQRLRVQDVIILHHQYIRHSEQ